MLYEQLYGYQNREAGIPISSDTQFRIGSNSKTFTTIAIFQLGLKVSQYINLLSFHSVMLLGSSFLSANQNLFDIDDNIADYLTEEDLREWGYIMNTTAFCPTLNGSTTCEDLTFRHLMGMRYAIVVDVYMLPVKRCHYLSDLAY